MQDCIQQWVFIIIIIIFFFLGYMIWKFILSNIEYIEGVDLRSSQVCELGLLNYKAKNVFYPFHTNKFRCRYDYYWASVFKVSIYLSVYVVFINYQY